MKLSEALSAVPEQQPPVEVAKPSLAEMDEILTSLAAKPPGMYRITPVQCDKIKQAWALLHIHDSAHEYTIAKNGTYLRKELADYQIQKKP